MNIYWYIYINIDDIFSYIYEDNIYIYIYIYIYNARTFSDWLKKRYKNTFFILFYSLFLKNKNSKVGDL